MKAALPFAALAASLSLFTAAPVLAQNSPWAIGTTVGSDGAGAEVKYALSPSLVVRARATGLDFSHSENSDGIHYSGKAKFGVGGAYLDWHPFRTGFLFSAGVLGGKREVDLNGMSNGNVNIHGDTYTPAQIGTVYGQAKLPSTAGFVGLGYDSTFVHRSPIGISFLVGAQLGGSPKVHLTSTGLLATTPQLQTDLAKEEDDIRRDLDFTKYYPAVSLGLTYRF